MLTWTPASSSRSEHQSWHASFRRWHHGRHLEREHLMEARIQSRFTARAFQATCTSVCIHVTRLVSAGRGSTIGRMGSLRTPGSGGVTRSMVLACRSVPMAEHRRPVGTGVEVEVVCLGEGMLVMMQAGEKSFLGGNVTLSRHQGGGGETSWVRAVMRSRRRGCRIFGCAGVETLELFGGHAGQSVGLFSSLPLSPTIPVPRGSFALRVVGGDGHCLAWLLENTLHADKACHESTYQPTAPAETSHQG